MLKKVWMFALLFVSLGLFTACTAQDDPAQETTYRYLSLTLNPSIDILIDEEEKVVRIALNNEAAETVAGDTAFIGMHYLDFLDAWLGLLEDVGFLDQDTVSILFIGGTEDIIDPSKVRINRRLLDQNLPAVLEEIRAFNPHLLDHAERTRITEILEAHNIDDYGKVRMAMAFQMATSWDEDYFEELIQKPIDELLDMVEPVMAERLEQFNTTRLEEARRLREALIAQTAAYRDARQELRDNTPPDQRGPIGRPLLDQNRIDEILEEELDEWIEAQRLIRAQMLEQARQWLDEHQEEDPDFPNDDPVNEHNPGQDME
ncbi:MAG: hypothetical protein EA374_07710 [Acholeplasmatales bacterium]|nr:MAG: hypothetical protein EA374_07710 [Acholeplasmatales bacterium]